MFQDVDPRARQWHWPGQGVLQTDIWLRTIWEQASASPTYRAAKWKESRDAEPRVIWWRDFLRTGP